MHARYIVKDTFYKKAKKEGYRARSAYKLEEMQQRFTIIKKGDRVLDLGAAPGSWVQLESALVGASRPGCRPRHPAHSTRTRLQCSAEEGRYTGCRCAGPAGEAEIPAFDVVTSDIAPNLSGIREVDIARIQELYSAVLRITDEGLRRGGNFLIKLFFSPDFADMAADAQAAFFEGHDF